jgi:hypothetical protein
LWRTNQHRFIVAAATVVLASAVILHWGLFNSTSWVVDRPVGFMRAALVVVQLLVFGAVFITSRWIRPLGSKSAAGALLAIAAAVVLASAVHASWNAPNYRRRDYVRQMELRQAALALPQSVSPDSIVLVDWSGVRKSHLYVRYWSGRDSFELTAQHPLKDFLAIAPESPDIYVLADAPPPAGAAQRLANGYLYRVR